MIVVDASVAVKWIVEEEGHAAALALTHADETLIAPDFVILETLNVLQRKLKQSTITKDQFSIAIHALVNSLDMLVPAASIADQASALASQLDHSVYDCAYLACAIQYNAFLVTADQKFGRKVVAAGYAKIIQNLSPAAAQIVASHQSLMPIEQRALELWDVFDRTMSHVRTAIQQPTRGLGLRFLTSSTDFAPAFESPAYLRLQRFVSGLTRSELTRLLALAWYGRPHTQENWDDIVAQAQQHISMNDEGLTSYVISTFGTLSRGIDKLNVFSSQPL